MMKTWVGVEMWCKGCKERVLLYVPETSESTLTDFEAEVSDVDVFCAQCSASLGTNPTHIRMECDGGCGRQITLACSTEADAAALQKTLADYDAEAFCGNPH